MTEPDGTAAPDPASISTDLELRAAVVSLLGDSYDRAVEARTGLSKTTVNDLRNQRRRLTLKTLTLIVDAYDPQRRDAWLAAWRRVRTRAAVTPAGPVPRLPEAPPAEPAPAHGRFGRHPRRLVIGGIAVAVCAAAAIVAVVIPGGPLDGAKTAASPATSAPQSPPTTPNGQGVSATPSGLGAQGLPPLGPDGLPPPGVPGGPGAAGPVGGPGPGPAPQGAEQSPRHGCYPMPYATHGLVVTQPGAQTSGVSLKAAAYTYYPAWNPSVAIAGQLSAKPSDRLRLVGADWADPATKDSTAAHNSGNGRYYPGGVLPLTDQNCFTLPPYNLGYGGYSGITTRVYLLLVAKDKAPALGREAARVAGFTDRDLTVRGAQVIGYFAVPPTGN